MHKKRALIFSGQGAQTVGMGADLLEHSAMVRHMYTQADETLGFPLSQYCFEGPQTKLTETAVCQPALYVHGLALLALVREQIPNFKYEATAGLSLGEYTAHAAAGTFDFATGLKLVYHRGRLMQESCDATHGGMLALVGATAQVAREIAPRCVWPTDRSIGQRSYERMSLRTRQHPEDVCEAASPLQYCPWMVRPPSQPEKAVALLLARDRRPRPASLAQREHSLGAPAVRNRPWNLGH